MSDKRKTWCIEKNVVDGCEVYYKGQMIYNELQFSFTCRSTPNGKGDLRVIIHIISPLTNKRLMYEGEKLNEIIERLSEKEKEAFRTGKQVEKLCITKEVIINLPKKQVAGISVSESNVREIKKAIENAVFSLYDDNYAQIKKIISNIGPNGDIHARAAFDVYNRSFFAGQKICTEQTTEEKKRALKLLCAALDEYPMGKIPTKKIASVYEMVKSKRDWKFNILKDFFDFCKEKSLYKGENPISEFLSTRPGPDDETIADAAARQALIPHILPLDVEKKMIQGLYTKIDNSAVLAVALSAGAGIGIEEMRKLKCSDVVVNEKNEMKIRLFKQKAGGTNNYTKPPLPAYRDLILARLAYLRDKYGEKKMQSMYLVPSDNSGASPMQASKITEFLRTTLIHAGMDYGQLSARSGKDRYELGGPGLKLLVDHYKSILTGECGVDSLSGIGNFMCGKSIGDTSTDFYRSLISEDGNHVLQGLVRRDAHLCAEKLDKECIPVIEEKDGKKKIILPEAGPKNLTGALIALSMRAGERLTITTTQGSNGEYYAGYGFSGDITVDLNDDKKTRYAREEW